MALMWTQAEPKICTLPTPSIHTGENTAIPYIAMTGGALRQALLAAAAADYIQVTIIDTCGRVKEYTAQSRVTRIAMVTNT